MKRAKAYEKLQSALLKEKFVRIVRRFDRADRIDGFVVAIGETWVLIRQADGNLGPDGWTALRVRDIDSIDKLGQPGDDDVEHRVFDALGEWPPSVPPACLIDDLASVIATSRQVSPIVAVHREASRPDALWVGAVAAVDGDSLVLKGLSSQAVWENSPNNFDADDVTRIEFGTRYLANLALVMGDIPG